MANANERFVFPDQVWYDANNPGSLHEALRADYARAKAAAERRPSLRRHMDACPQCQAIGEVTSSPVPPRKRLKIDLTHDRLRDLLALPAQVEILHVYAENDPNVVTILLAGDPTTAADVGGDTTTRAS